MNIRRINREDLVNIIHRHVKGALTDAEVSAFAEALERAGFRRSIVMLDVECSKCAARDQRPTKSRNYTGCTGPCKECGERTFPLGVLERKAIRKKQHEEEERILDAIFGAEKKREAGQ